MSYNYTNLDSPFLEHIPGGLTAGKMIIIKGFTQYGFERVSINFQSDSSDDAVIAFHLNPRLDSSEVCCNSYEYGWGDEELHSDYFPFDEGERFTLRIVVEENAYRVFVNGRFLLEFEHRVSYDSVKWLRIGEGIELHEVIIRDFVKVPYVGTIENGMSVGKAVQIKGVPTFDEERFCINFCYEGYDDECIGLHFNPRPDGETVVLNNYDDGWGEEQVIDYNPFRPWSMFNLMFVATEEGMKIFLDNQLFATYEFRSDLGDLRYLHIKGAVSIASVEYLEPLPNNFMKEIPSGLRRNDVIKVKGFFQTYGERIVINFKTGDEIPFHFNPRCDEGEIVMNNYSSDEWGEEVREPIPECFTAALPFEVKIKVKDDKFKIYVNERSYGKFYMRQEIDFVSAINCAGDAYFYQVKVLRRMDSPYIEELPSAMDYGRWLHIDGAVIKHKEMFNIDLKSGDENVVMHFNPRIPDGVVVRNSYWDGDWGEEERDSEFFPFEESEPFDIFISSQSDAYKIYVNGQFLADFWHRYPCQSVTHLLVGDGAHFFEPEIL